MGFRIGPLVSYLAEVLSDTLPGKLLPYDHCKPMAAMMAVIIARGQRNKTLDITTSTAPLTTIATTVEFRELGAADTKKMFVFL